jgi:hypothetical protein
MKGLFAWIGFRQVAVPYERAPRLIGNTKWNYSKLLNLSVEGITSFSIAPLRAASYVGLITATTAVIYGLYMIVRTILFGNPVAGYPSLLVIILFLGPSSTSFRPTWAHVQDRDEAARCLTTISPRRRITCL